MITFSHKQTKMQRLARICRYLERRGARPRSMQSFLLWDKVTKLLAIEADGYLTWVQSPCK